MSTPFRRRVPHPIFRKLRVFAIDPGMTARFETAVMNETTLAIPWEQLEPGPVGEYVAVVDEDEAGKRVHDPVDLDRPDILAQHGLPPSDGNPQFRQQMVYAVAMHTIRNFERALGRAVHWAPRVAATGMATGMKRKEARATYQKRLRLYPHYLKEANAYYSLEKQSTLFGYFLSSPESPFPGKTVFSCLSQDVIAHQLTHALLTGMRINLDFGSNPDVAAFHEAFADLVGLLQHFSPSDVLRQQIASIRGHLEERSSLGTVGLQFGQAIGRMDGLRNALGFTGDDKQWHARVPDPKAYGTTYEPHARGDILVGAVFEAFKKIYESRVSDLRRIASKGTGLLPQGTLHPDLVNRFAQEASRTAQRLLELCLRAIDYIPPVEITFGDYLRAVLTTHHDFDPVDEGNYRLAFVDAFRSYGILPAGVGTLSQETLLWPQAPPASDKGLHGRGRSNRWNGTEIVSKFVSDLSRERTPWNLPRDRQKLWELLETKQEELFRRLRTAKPSVRLGPIDLRKPFEVQSFHPCERATLTGDLTFQWVIKLVQKLYSPPGKKRKRDEADSQPQPLAGVTLLVDGDTGRIRYQIEKTT